MRRTALMVLAAAGGIFVLILVAAAIAIATVDLRTLVGPVQARIKTLTGRDLGIAGPIDFKLSLEPKVVLNDVTFGNAPWGSTKEMMSARRVVAQVKLLPLIDRRFEVVELSLTDPVFTLETNAEGRGNWDFDMPQVAQGAPLPPPGAAAAGALAVGLFVIDNGTVSYRDAKSGNTTRIAIERMSVRTRGRNDPIDAEFRGKVDDIALALTGNLGPLYALRFGHWPYPISVKGEVDQKPASVTAKLTGAPGMVTLDDLDLALGAFSAKGRVAITTEGARRKYVFSLDVPSVAARDFPVPVATRTASPGALAPASTPAPSSRRVFSDTRIPLDGLRSFDAEGDLKIAELRIDERVKIAPFQARLTLHQGRLEVSRIAAGAFGGSLNGNLTLDAARADAAKLALKLDGRSLNLGAMLAAAGKPRETRGGATTLSLDINASGDSPHAWASTSSGNASAIVGPTTLVNTRIDLDNVFDKLGHAVNPFREVDPSTELQCAVVRLPLANGVSRIDHSIGMETKKIGVTASGTLDFRNETLDLALRPRIKQGVPIDIPRFAELVRFTGPFADPRVSIDAVASAETIAKIGAAISTGGLSVLGTSLLKGATDSESACDVASGRRSPTPASTEGAPKQGTPPAGAIPDEIGKALGRLLRR